MVMVMMMPGRRRFTQLHYLQFCGCGRYLLFLRPEQLMSTAVMSSCRGRGNRADPPRCYFDAHLDLPASRIRRQNTIVGIPEKCINESAGANCTERYDRTRTSRSRNSYSSNAINRFNAWRHFFVLFGGQFWFFLSDTRRTYVAKILGLSAVRGWPRCRGSFPPPYHGVEKY